MSEDKAVQQEQSDTGTLDSSTRSNPNNGGQQDTAGALLREARQVQGLDIATLAALLKVPVQKLQALENDQFDHLMDSVFARALASSMCRILKLDPAPVLQRLPAIAAFKVTSQNRGINKPFRAPSGGHGASVQSHISRSALLLGLALLLGALVLIFLPVIQQEIVRYKQQRQSVSTQSELVEPSLITTSVTTQVVANSAASGVVLTTPVALPPPAEVQSPVSNPVNPATASTSLSVASAADANANAAVTFRATGESWVKVIDAKGVVALNRALRAGESAGVSGAMPLTTVIGRADAIQVQVHGQAFDLAGFTKNNIARFEVK